MVRLRAITLMSNERIDRCSWCQYHTGIVGSVFMSSRRFKWDGRQPIRQRICRLRVKRAMGRGDVGSLTRRRLHIQTDRLCLLIGDLLALHESLLLSSSLFRNLGFSHPLFEISHFGLLPLYFPLPGLISCSPVLIAQRRRVLYPHRSRTRIAIRPWRSILNWTMRVAVRGRRRAVGVSFLPVIISLNENLLEFT